MYKQSIPRYVCIHGVWQPNFGDGKKFTKNDVKKIHMVRNTLCIYIVLKDGTTISPDYVIAANEDVLEMRFNDWITDIFHLKGTFSIKQRDRVKYAVYLTNGEYVGETTAVSPKDAVNKVRFREFGYSVSNDNFFATRADGLGNDLDEDGLFWYAIEFSIAGADEREFDPSNALYEIVHAESRLKAKDNIEYEYFKIEDDACSFVNIRFGRIEEFTSAGEAISCLSKWRL